MIASVRMDRVQRLLQQSELSLEKIAKHAGFEHTEYMSVSIQCVLVDRIRQGVTLQELIIAGALANARSFGGQDYNGYHTFMALAPALELSKQLPTAERPLPVLKVLYRNDPTGVSLASCGRFGTCVGERIRLPRSRPIRSKAATATA